MPKGEVVEFDDVACTHETDKAILCTIDGKEHWIPKSQVNDDSEVYENGGSGKLVITEWIAKERGLI